MHMLMLVLAISALVGAILALMNKVPLTVPVFILACMAVIQHFR